MVETYLASVLTDAVNPYTIYTYLKIPTPYTYLKTSYTIRLPVNPYTIHRETYLASVLTDAVFSKPYALHPTPYSLHLAPYILHPTPYTLHPES